MQGNKAKIHDIFNSGRLLKIPFFQRSYVWQKDNWERLLEDVIRINEESQPYFIGSCILKQIDTQSTDRVGDVRLVIDGQQRITTIMLFLKALWSIKGSELCKKKLFNDYGNIILEHNYNDREIFEAIINEKATTELENKYKNNNVLKCYNYFLENQNDLKNIDENKVINNLYFLSIDLEKEEDEQLIFNTMNSLGVKLTTSDLLKNYLYKENELDIYEETWKKQFEKAEDKKEYWDYVVTTKNLARTNLDMLIQSVLMIKKQGALNISKLFKETADYIEEKSRSNANFKELFIKDLMSYSDIYIKYINEEVLQQPLQIEQDDSYLQQKINYIIFQLDNTTVIPYILYILNLEISEQEKLAVVIILEKYILRRYIVSKSSNDYNTLFVALIKEGINNATSLRDYLNKYGSPSDMDIQNSFAKEYKRNNTKPKNILYFIETNLWHKYKGGKHCRGIKGYTLEHIMPKKWREVDWMLPVDLSGVELENFKEKRNKLINTIGNMTLLTEPLNKSISNGSWQKKQVEIKKHSGDFKIFEEVNETTWDSEKIDRRTEELLGYILEQLKM